MDFDGDSNHTNLNRTDNINASSQAASHGQYHTHSSRPQRIHFFETQFHHVQAPFTIACWFFIITLSKIAFHRVNWFKRFLPDSALLLVAGCIFGVILHFLIPDEEVYLQPNWFFLFLLPPIALEAGYFLPNKLFFQNIGTIISFAVFGTLWNILSIGATLYLFHNYFHGQPSAIDLLLFATLISAVDPVAVICVFEEIHVNHLLYICVFGESLLNDAVTIVLYHDFTAIAEVGLEHIHWADYLLAALAFSWVSIGGILIGVAGAVLTGAVTRWGSTVTVIQPLTCLLFPYLAYLSAEALGLSGILAIVVCGLLMKQYIAGNITEQSLATINYFIKTLSSSCEAMIFVFLGLSVISKNHDFDFIFILVTLCACFIYRFIGVWGLSYLVNKRRMQKINPVDQFIMAYGGIRGAVCYGLVMSLDAQLVGSKNAFATTTIVVILFTVFVQGGSIRKLVTSLRVKRSSEHRKNVIEMIFDNAFSHITGGMESIAGLHGNYWMQMRIEHLNDYFIKPFIMRKHGDAATIKLLRTNEEIQTEEALLYFKQHGSFAGMPTVQSKAELSEPTQQPSLLINGKRYKSISEEETQNQSHQSTQVTIPRNESISVFLRDKLAEIDVATRPRYSRHYMEDDFGERSMPPFPLLASTSIDEEPDDSSKYLTYPYSKSSQRSKLISTIRKASRANQQLQPPQQPTVMEFFIG